MPRALAREYTNLIQKLDQELSKHKAKFQMAQELKVKWLPNGNNKKSGEILGKIIHIYEEDGDKALDTLRHEFIEYILTYELVAPYKKLVNKLISLFEEEMYDKKEKLIEKLVKII